MTTSLPWEALPGPLAFHQALCAEFPDRQDLRDHRLEGSVQELWDGYGRQLRLTPPVLASHLARQWGLDCQSDLSQVSPEALRLIPAHFCQAQRVLPVALVDGELVVATADPANGNVRERARFIANRPIRWVLAPPRAILEAAEVAFAMEAQRLAGRQSGLQSVDDLDDHAVVRLGRSLLTQAIEARASDLHIQPFLGAMAVRIRVDGQLRRLAMLPDAVASSLLRHLKARSGMDSTNVQVPQDGRMSLVLGDREFDLRVSSLPASRGERLVIRFLDQSRVHRLGGVGFSVAALQALRRALQLPAGMVVLTGPTGSGKTSTLYGLIGEINRSAVNIITVENPVEYRIAGVSQVEVNDKSGRTFAAALRAILRQDPDVLLVGEIRDAETADIATQAALTGHLVLTTLHTNDALTTIPRLINLGVQPTILADALAVVVSQRLCRRLCERCKAVVTPPLTGAEQAFADLSLNQPAYRPVGCSDCAFTGFHGRLPIVEVLETTPALRAAVAAGESRLAVLDGLREGGLRSLSASGALRIISGDTTVDEVLSVIGPQFWHELATHFGTRLDQVGIPEPRRAGDAGPGVLLLGVPDPLARQIEEALMPEGLRCVRAPTAEQAHDCLQRDEDLSFIIGDLQEDMDLAAAQQHLRHNRLHISWARLPAVVLLPTHLITHEDDLRRSGVMAGFLHKPLDTRALLAFIRRSRAR